MGSSLKNITVPEGRDVVLSCTVKNLDGHKVAWIHYDRYAILILILFYFLLVMNLNLVIFS